MTATGRIPPPAEECGDPAGELVTGGLNRPRDSRRPLRRPNGVALLVGVSLLGSGFVGDLSAQRTEAPFRELPAPAPRFPASPIATSFRQDADGRGGVGPPVFVGVALTAGAGSALGALASAALRYPSGGSKVSDAYLSALALSTFGSATGAYLAGRQEGVEAWMAGVGSLVGLGGGILAASTTESVFVYPVAQGVTTAAVAEVLRRVTPPPDPP